MTGNWDSQAEFIATAIDPRGRGLWLVQLGSGRTLVASFLPSSRKNLERLAPGDLVRIRFRSDNKTPRILGYLDVDPSDKRIDEPT